MSIIVELVLRTVLGRPLTNSEVDSNFTNLKSAIEAVSQTVDNIQLDPTEQINTAFANFVSQPDPLEQYALRPNNDAKLRAMRGSSWEEIEIRPPGDLGDFALRNYRFEQTSGTYAAEEINVNVEPTANTTAVTLGQRITSTFNGSEFTGNVGQSHGGLQVSVNTFGTKEVDKAVGILVHANFADSGRRNAVLCYEAGTLQIPANSDIGSFAGFYFPNLQAIPNIDRIGTKAAFANHDPRFMIHNTGVYADKLLRQLAPPLSTGVVPGRYYTAPFFWRGYMQSTANVAHLSPVFVPKRTRITELGFLTEATGTGRQARLAMYAAMEGGLGALQGQTAVLAANAAGKIAGAVNFEVDAGMYWLALTCNGAFNIGSHSCSAEDWFRTWLFGQSDPELKENNLVASAAIQLPAFPTSGYPENPNIVPTFLTNRNEAHIWYRTS